jgi:hypothetical protein
LDNKVTALDLRGRKLVDIPTEVWKCPQLEILLLERVFTELCLMFRKIVSETFFMDSS